MYYVEMSCSKDVLAVPSVTSSKCKKCKYPTSNGVCCIKCGAISHPSCAKLLKNTRLISDTEMICCDFDECSVNDNKEDPVVDEKMSLAIQVLFQNAISPLLEEVQKLRDEVKVIKETNCDLIRLLTDKKSYRDVATSKVTENNNCSNVVNQIINKPNNLNGPIPHTAADCSLAENHKNANKKDHAYADCEIPAENLTKSVPAIHTAKITVQNDDSNGWKVQKGKSRKRMQNTVVGSAKVDPEISFAAPHAKKAWLYIGRVQSGTEPNKIKSYLVNKIPEVEDAIIEKLNTKGSNMSFKVGIDFRYKDQILKEDFWPNGVIIRRFNFGPSTFLGVKPSPNLNGLAV